jgi:hypothetical protein
MESIPSNKRKNIKLRKKPTVKPEFDTTSDKFSKVSTIVPPNLNYDRIKYKNQIYKINDFLLIRDPLVPDGYLITKLLSIIPTNGIEKYPYWPAIKVQW